MRHLPHISRRNFIATATAGLASSALALPAPPRRVKSIIHLFMEGGMSHLDTFDPKPHVGSAPAISTNLPAISISANLPRLAGHMEKLTLVRSISHTARNHHTAGPLATDFSGEWIMADSIASTLHLSQAGTPRIRATLSGWDTHTESSRRNSSQCQLLDYSLSQLLEKLSKHDMLAETLIILTTEFGRSAALNGYGGRNHHPHAYTCLFAGGGTHGGRVIGSTSPDGMEVCGAPIHPQDFIKLLSPACSPA